MNLFAAAAPASVAVHGGGISFVNPVSSSDIATFEKPMCFAYVLARTTQKMKRQSQWPDSPHLRAQMGGVRPLISGQCVPMALNQILQFLENVCVLHVFSPERRKNCNAKVSGRTPPI